MALTPKSEPLDPKPLNPKPLNPKPYTLKPRVSLAGSGNALLRSLLSPTHTPSQTSGRIQKIDPPYLEGHGDLITRILIRIARVLMWGIGLRVQVSKNHTLAQNLYYNYNYQNPKYPIIGYMDP